MPEWPTSTTAARRGRGRGRSVLPWHGRAASGCRFEVGARRRRARSRAPNGARIEDAARTRALRVPRTTPPTGWARSRSPSGTRIDDQAETFLLRLIRGAGPRGLAGILPQRRPRRPSAASTSARAELRDYLAAPACVPRGRDERRRSDSAEPCPARADAVSRTASSRRGRRMCSAREAAHRARGRRHLERKQSIWPLRSS